MSSDFEALSGRIAALEERQAKDAESLQALWDMEAIRVAKYRYLRAIDTADLELLTSVLTEDFSCRYIGGTYEFVASGRTEFVGMIANSFHADFAGQHHGHHPEITLTSKTEATGIWYLQDIVFHLDRNEFLYGTLLYRDRYVKRDGEWRIEYSEYERVVEMVEQTPRAPNYTSRYLAKHGKKLG